jgi:hypothetical protein
VAIVVAIISGWAVAAPVLTESMIPQLIASVDKARLASTMRVLASSKYDAIVDKILALQSQPASFTRESSLAKLREEFDLIASRPAPGDYITTRSTFSDKSPTGRGIGQAAAWLEDSFRALSPRLQVKQDCFEVLANLVCNVMATLPAEDPETAPIVVLGAHYDSRADGISDGTTDAPGATDNASGTALVLEFAKIVSGYRFPVTFVFVAFAAEEQGLRGSIHLSEQLVSSNQNVLAMFNNDLVGNSRGNRGGIDNALGPELDGSDLFRVFTDTNVPGASELWLSAEEQTSRYGSLIGAHAEIHDAVDRQGRGGDHKPFLARGIPAIRFVAGLEDYSHQHATVRWLEDGTIVGDLIAFTDMSYLERLTKANLAVILPLAIRGELPRIEKLSTVSD